MWRLAVLYHHDSSLMVFHYCVLTYRFIVDGVSLLCSDMFYIRLAAVVSLLSFDCTIFVWIEANLISLLVMANKE
jgi:hypothetical protein